MPTDHAERADRIARELAQQVDDLDLPGIRANVRRFCEINMSFGALAAPDDGHRANGRAAAPPQHVWWSGSRLGAQPLTPPEESPEPPRRFDREQFPAFDTDESIRTCWLAVAAITGIAATGETLKPRLVAALNELQRTSLPCAPDAVLITFDSEPVFEALAREAVLAAGEPPAGQRFPEAERPRMAAAIRDAFEYIRAVDRPLHDLIVSTVSAIACIRREGTSGSVSSLIGLIWLNPTEEWTVVDYAENIVHEFIHTSIFLEDLVHGVFTKSHNYTPPESLVTSAILKYPRGFNIAFHSFYVAAGLTIVLRAAGQHERAAQIASGIATTLPQLRRLTAVHLTPHARERFALLTSAA